MKDDASNQIAGITLKIGPARERPPEELAKTVRTKRTIGRIVLEHGVEMTWPPAGEPNEDQVWGDLRAYTAKIGLRPVLVQDGHVREKWIGTLVGTDGSVLSIVPSRFFIEGEDLELYDNVASKGYFLNGVMYHLQQLIKHYCDVAESIPDTMKSNHPVSCGLRSEIYHEFDALMSNIRRGYDVLQEPLQVLAKEENGELKDKLVAPREQIWMPNSRAEIKTSRKQRGKRVQEYRDCIHHYVPVNTWLSTVTVEWLDDDKKKVVAMIPDNPDARSRKQFKYERRIDALSFGWEATSELFRIASLFREEVRKTIGV